MTTFTDVPKEVDEILGKRHGTTSRRTFLKNSGLFVVSISASAIVRANPLWDFLLSIPKGFAAAEEIIFLVFIVGGVIAILRKTGAIDAALHRAVARLGGSPWILIAGCLLMFSLGSYTIGMGEEYVPLIPIIVTMSLAMRMDAIVAMGMVWVPYGIGWACAGTNPFGVLIAQNIANVPITSGWFFRLVMMTAFLAIAFHHLYRYAMLVRANPQSSLVAHVDYSSGFDLPADVKLTGARIAILLLFIAGIVGFVAGVALLDDWYISELLAIFMAVGIGAAMIARMSPGETSRTFITGAADMTAAALLIGFARTIEVVLSDGQVIDTVINSIAGVLTNLGPMPMMPFMGVRISWLMVARNDALAFVADSASSRNPSARFRKISASSIMLSVAFLASSNSATCLFIRFSASLRSVIPPLVEVRSGSSAGAKRNAC